MQTETKNETKIPTPTHQIIRLEILKIHYETTYKIAKTNIESLRNHETTTTITIKVDLKVNL